MNGSHRARLWRIGLVIVWLCGGLALPLPGFVNAQEVPGDQRVPKADEKLPRPRAVDRDKDVKTEPAIEESLPKRPASILPKEMNALDLACALRLAGVENPDILIARQRVARAAALRFLAYSFVLPNLNSGFNYDDHNGPLQQSSGNILNVNRQALYLGLGAGAIAAGTVGVPGVQYNLNFSEGLFNLMAIRYNLRARQAESVAVRNQIFRRVTTGYMELVRAEAWRSIAIQNQEQALEIARLTAAQARNGIGRDADAARAAAELARRNEIILQAEQAILVASARLAALLNIPPSVQLHAIDGWVIPTEIVPNAIPLHELLFIATQQRPELAARSNMIREAVMQMRNQMFLPLSPTVIAGYSAGTFGGGSNLVAYPQGFGGFKEPYFGSFGPRDDVDVLMFWTAQNMGVGNYGRVRVARADVRIAELEWVRTLNRVRDEVATTYAQIHAHYGQIDIARRGVVAGGKSYEEDYKRIKATVKGALPIELLNSLHLLAQARMEYLDSVVNYDIAQFALFVALGQPPTSNFAHEIPSDLVPPPQSAPPLPACVPPGGGPGACVVNKPQP